MKSALDSYCWIWCPILIRLHSCPGGWKALPIILDSRADLSPFNYDQSTPTGVDSVPVYKPPQRFSLTWANTPSKLTWHLPVKIILFPNPLFTQIGGMTNEPQIPYTINFKSSKPNPEWSARGKPRVPHDIWSLPSGFWLLVLGQDWHDLQGIMP